MTDADVADQIRALEDRRYQALTDGDVAALEELFADDLVYTHSDAKTDSKRSFIDKVATGQLKYGQLSHPVSGIIVRADCALVLGDMRGDVQVGAHGQPITRDALRARLGVSNQAASELLRQLRSGEGLPPGASRAA